MISRLGDMMNCEDENRDSETCCDEMVSNYEEHDVWQELHTLRELVRMIDPDKWTSDYVPPVTDEIEEILESVS